MSLVSIIVACTVAAILIVFAGVAIAIDRICGWEEDSDD